ncbi:hypothetical protein BD769DRAFT_1668128 [Suillus cothurnatus]|nr:hypothetical protein BD769DRAFT_1668128 [Suillus cothurnatus]
MAHRKYSPSLSKYESASSPSSDSEDRLCSPAQKTSKRLTKRKQHSSKSDNEKPKSKKKESSADPCEELYIAAAHCITQYAGQLSEDENDIAHQENQLAGLSQKTQVRFQRNYKCLLELALGLKARSDNLTHLMIQIVKYAALDPAKKLHPQTVEAAYIAYSCVQARFGLGAQNIWMEEDSDFKYRDFYHNIIELIEDLKLFNNDDGVDVARDSTEDTALSSTHKGGSDLAHLCAQMAAHNAAAKIDTTYLEHPAAPLTVAVTDSDRNSVPRTALTQRHALMIIMFIAHAFAEMLLQDIHCRVRYPVPLTCATLKELTDILLFQLSHILNTGWDDYVAQAPPSWKEDNFLTNNAPVGVTIQCGQNQLLLVHGALDDECRKWDNITITLIFGSLPSLWQLI